MMMFAGSIAPRVAALVMLVMMALPAGARITSEVDRTDVALGETLNLTLRADSGEYPDEIDLSELERDFEILQRSSATSARIVGGEQSVTRTLELELAPRRDGLLVIPALAHNGRRTTPIAIKVSPEPEVAPGDALVLFGAEVDRTDAYVQAQILLTITLQEGINLDKRAVSELDIPGVYIEPLEQRSYQRRANGRLWRVTELRYALFPQESGAVTIPAMSFSGRELLPGRSLLGARLGRRIALESDPINITVKPVPADFPGSVWLPARHLELKSQWSTAPERLVVGDSSTRSIELVADGLQGSQLPPITSLGDSGSRSGLRFYPDQETIEQRETSSGIQGYRLQSEALVATTPGTWELPERSVPWWNIETDSLEYARLPPVTVEVAAAASPGTIAGNTAVDADTQTVSGFNEAGSAVPGLFWQLASASGWLLALILGYTLWRSRRTVGTPLPSPPRQGIGNRELIPLRLACSENNPGAAREALLLWGQQWLNRTHPPSMSQLTAAVSPELAQEIAELDNALWGKPSRQWQGDRLFQLVREQSRQAETETGDGMRLYPETSRR